MKKSLLTSLPKLLTFAVALCFLPLSLQSLPVWLGSCFFLSLVLHQLSPRKTDVVHDWSDVAVIAANIALTFFVALSFLHFASPGIQDVTTLSHVPLLSLAYIPLWTAIEEVLFFFIHRFAHLPGVYERCHKWHHKHKVTSAWTSFVAHPLDHLIAVLGAALIAPLVQMRWLAIPVAPPVIGAFMLGAIITFVNSHHTTMGEDGGPEGGDHLLHHMLFVKNYSNFGYLDVWNKSYRSAEEVKKEVKKA
jgi:sterol desaturase/sphingolipid hydroxylase (fatty acid hydroxylase superfamily)